LVENSNPEISPTKKDDSFSPVKLEDILLRNLKEKSKKKESNFKTHRVG